MIDSADIPSDLAALYAEEAASSGASAVQRREIRDAIGATLGIAIASAGGTAAAATTTTTAGAATAVMTGTTKLVVAVLVAAGIGGGTAAVVEHRAVASRVESNQHVAPRGAAVANVETIETAVRVEVPPLPEPPTELPSGQARAIRLSRTSVSSTKVMHDVDVETSSPDATKRVVDEQRTVLTRAWGASSRGEHAAALALIDGVQAGPFDEERDALRVHVLSKLGRHDEARERSRAFRQRYPRSIHTGLLPAEETP